MKTVRETLLFSLFHNTPPFMGELVGDHENLVFPGKEDFISFLQETDSQKRVDMAQSILTRLAYESEVLVPQILLDSILAAEELVGPNVASQTYSPRDHFVHLVHLYLLGIYIFTHHKRLNRSLMLHFKGLRHQAYSDQPMNSSDEAAFKDFVFAWRSFVLMHDLAYPWELMSGKGDQAIEKLRSPYDQLTDLLETQVSVAFAAKMATWGVVDEHQTPLPLNKCAPNLFAGNKSQEGEFSFMGGLQSTRISDEMCAAMRIPTIHGKRFRSILTSIVPLSQMAALLVHSRSGNIVCTLMPDGKGGHLQHFHAKDWRFSTESLSQMAFIEGRTPRIGDSQQFEWHLFIMNYADTGREFTAKLKAACLGELRDSTLRELGKTFSTGIPAPVQSITSDRDFADCDFWIYKLMLKWSKDVYFSTLGDSFSSTTKKVVRSHEDNIQPLLVQFLENRLKKHFEKNPISATTLKQGVDKVIDAAFKPLQPLDVLKKDFAKKFGDRLKKSNAIELLRQRVFKDLKNISKKIWCDFPPPVFSRILSGELKTEEKLKYFPEMDALDPMLKKMGLPTLVQLLSKYRPTYLREGAHDHGIAGAVFALLIGEHMSDMLDFAIKRSEDGEIAIAKYLRIANNLGDESDNRERSYQYRYLLKEVALAIGVHNIYPSHLEGHNSFRVGPSAPFVFFAMLCDGLQAWDRDARIRQSEVRLPYKTSGDSFNVYVEGDKIKISEADQGVDVVRRAKALRENFELYLEGAKDYLSIAVGEWKGG